MKNWIIVIPLVILLCGVLFFVFRNDEQDLGNNYFYLPKYEAVDIGYTEGAIIHKSAEMNVFTNVRIHGDVISVNTNEDYILAIQNTENKSLQYYIIEKKSDLIYEPFKKEEYLQKHEELGVPRELKLKDE